MSALANIAKIPELRRRILFTLMMVAVYRVGIFVTTFLVQLFQYHLIGQLCWYDRTVLGVPRRGE